MLKKLFGQPKKDPALRLVISALATKPDLTDDQRDEFVQDLLDTGLTFHDVRELYPSLITPFRVSVRRADPSSMPRGAAPTPGTTNETSSTTYSWQAA